MRLSINPVVVEDVTCTEAEVSVAVSNSVAIRIVPVSPAGVEYQEAALGVVGDSDQADIAVFLTSVAAATSALLTARGI